MEKIYYIYAITNIENNKKYVGFHSTYNINDSYMGSGIAINNAYMKYGQKSFTKKILEYCNESNWREKEKYWIHKLKTFGSGYNLTKGGEGVLGYKHTSKNKKKMSVLKTGKKLSKDHRIKIGKAHIGLKCGGGWNKDRLWSNDIKNKISESHKGKKKSQKTKRKMSDSKKELYSNKLKHPRTKIFIIHKPDGSKIICLGTFRKFRDKNKTAYNKYFKKIIDLDIPMDNWYFKEYPNLNLIENIEDYKLYNP